MFCDGTYTLEWGMGFAIGVFMGMCGHVTLILSSTCKQALYGSHGKILGILMFHSY